MHKTLVLFLDLKLVVLSSQTVTTLSEVVYFVWFGHRYHFQAVTELSAYSTLNVDLYSILLQTLSSNECCKNNDFMLISGASVHYCEVFVWGMRPYLD